MAGKIDFDKHIDISKLKNKTALITGGASGLGSGIAAAFAEHGAHVTIADINGQRGTEYAKELTSKGYSVNFAHTDVTSWSSQVAAFKSAIAHSRNQSLDIVVAAAGLLGSPFILPSSEPASLDKDPQEPPTVGAVMDVNFKGIYFTSRMAEHYFSLLSPTNSISGDQKSLTIFGSLASYFDFPPIADYLASKAAVRGFFRATRSTMAERGCRMNLIAPDIMDTPMAKDFVGMFRSKGFSVGNPKDVVDVVVRCAVDDEISGRSIGVDVEGGFDLRDDPEGQDGRIVVQTFLDRRGQKVIDSFRSP